MTRRSQAVNTIKRLIAVVLCMCLSLQFIGCSSETPRNVVDNTKSKVVSWFSNLNIDRFQDGCEYALEYMNIQTSAFMTSEYMGKIETAITSLKESMNAASGSARSVAQEAGFAAEKWTAGTFNINSAANNSPYTADVLSSNELGSVDVTTNYGENASLKYYQTARDSANAQSKAVLKAYKEYASKSNDPKSLEEYLDSNNIDTKTKEALYKSVYEGQTRIIPEDHLAEATQYLQGKIDRLTIVEGEATSLQVETYKETLENLRDRLQAPDGTQSMPLTNEEAQAIAELSQKGQFKPEDFGVTLSKVVDPKLIMKQAMGAGLGVGLLKTVFEVGPDLYSILVEAAKTGNISEIRLKEIGVNGTVAMTEGFVEGSVCSTIVSLCKSGALGAVLKEASPSVVATLTFLVIEAAISGYELAQGKITKEEYGDLMFDRVMISLLLLPTPALVAAVLPASKIALLAGCLAGGMLVCTGYGVAKEAIMDFVDGGGIEAIVPKGLTESVSVARNNVKQFNITEMTSSFGNFIITKLSDGCIKIKSWANT